MSKDRALDIVLSEFLELAKVPRPSHHEERVSRYLFEWAERHGLAVERDSLNDIIIDKPASPGCENVPRVIFQAHMDMVCVSEEGVDYDPVNDPIKIINDGVTLTAAWAPTTASVWQCACIFCRTTHFATVRYAPFSPPTRRMAWIPSISIPGIWTGLTSSIWTGKR